MKNILITATLSLLFGFSQAQIAIGKNNVSTASVSLEFGNENRGLLLPWVTAETAVVSPENGTIIYDAAANKVKVKYVAGWQDLSIDAAGTTINPNTGIDGLLIQNGLAENTDAKVSIGEPTDVNGILVLEDTDKAMVLPLVESPDLNIINPTPGLMVYNPTSQRLAVFNGTVWSFWKAEN
ncbi:MAG: hypothetical protein WCY77_05030 [Weeksellaceae bacterium]